MSYGHRASTKATKAEQETQRKIESALLKAAWDRVAKTRDISQREMGKQAGVTQPTVSHCLTGRMDISMDLKLAFCRYLDMAPIEIWPDFRFPDICPGGLHGDASRIVENLHKLSDAELGTILALITQLTD